MNKYMEKANELAKENLITNDGGPFGAVIVKNNEIIGMGNNKVLINHDPTAHAEIMAIKDACKTLNTHDLKDCEIYTSCYPCPMCLSAIIWANIKIIYYGNTKEDAKQIGFKDNFIYEYFNNKSEDVLKINQIDRNETIKTFNEYDKKVDKTIY